MESNVKLSCRLKCWVRRGLFAIAIVVGVAHSGLIAQDEVIISGESALEDRRDAEEAIVEQEVTFSFDSAPWSEVLRWLAEINNLSYTVEVVPSGTLNFIDSSRTYSPKEAMDEINGQLLPIGYTLVRREQTMYIIDLDNSFDRKLIADLLSETAPAELDDIGRFEIAKVRFQLKSIDTEDANKQIEALIGPHGSVVTVPLARQLIVTESGGNLRTINAILTNVEKLVGGEGMHSFRLKSATGDDVLAVAKPLLGIPAESNAAEDGSVRISTDTKGKVIYATGTPQKMSLVKQIVDQVESDAAASGVAEKQELISHQVKREDPKVVLRVLETLFSADPRVRMQPRSDSILALATLSQHELIKATINEVESEPTRTVVIPLRRNEPTLMVALIERMFGSSDDDDEATSATAPIVDATFEPDRLIVRGSAAQIDQIKELLGQFGEPTGEQTQNVGGPYSRILPIPEEAMGEAIERLRSVWGTMGNGARIRVIESPSSPLIRVVPRDEDIQQLPQPNGPDSVDAPGDDNTTYNFDSRSRTRLVAQFDEDKKPEAKPTQAPATTPANRPADIILSPTPDGLVVVSDDPDAVDRLEELLTGVGNSGQTRYHLFHLKHVAAEEAKTLLDTLFTGNATGDASASTDRSGALGMFTGGSASITAPSMIADKRLNRLWIQGTAGQIRDVQQYLRVIDVEDGPVDVQTNPKPAYIPVFYTSAESIVTVLKEIYAERIFDPSRNNRAAAQGGRGGGFGGFGGFGGRGGGNTQASSSAATTGDLPKMTITSEASSNLVVVSAPGPLLKEITEVIEQLDVRAKNAPSEDFQLGRLSGSSGSPELIKKFFQGAYGDIVQTEGSGIAAPSTNNSGSRTSSSNTRTGSADPRAAFIEMIRNRGGTTGGFGGRGGGGATGGRGGGRGTGGGGGRGTGGGGGRGGR